MKIFFVALGIIAALIIVIVAIGALLPKRHVATRSARLKAAPETVFRLISGPQDWRSDLREYKFYEEDGRHMIRETDKHGQTITYEIVLSQYPTQLKRTIADKSLPFGGSWTWQIQSTSEGSVVTITEEGEVRNPVFRFVSRFFIGLTRTLDNYLAMLANAAERNDSAKTSDAH